MAGNMMNVLNLNERAWKIADDLAARADQQRLVEGKQTYAARGVD